MSSPHFTASDESLGGVEFPLQTPQELCQLLKDLDFLWPQFRVLEVAAAGPTLVYVTVRRRLGAEEEYRVPFFAGLGACEIAQQLQKIVTFL